MSRIAVLMTDMFEDVEYEKPADAFSMAGHELIRVGLSAKSPVRGKRGMIVKIDRAVHDVRTSDFDALFIPGGYSPDRLRIDDDAGTIRTGICHQRKAGLWDLSCCPTPHHSQCAKGTAGDRVEVNNPGY